MAIATAFDDAVKDVSYRGFGDAKLGAGFFLRHHFAQAHELAFQAKGIAAVGCRPGNVFLAATMSRAVDFSRAVVQGDDKAAGGNVAPCSAVARGFCSAALHECATASALGTTGTVFVGFYPEVKGAFSRK